MSKKEKLIRKLRAESIDANELRTLMGQLDWQLDRTSGSHEVWGFEGQSIVLATHGKDLKMYQKKEALRKLLGE